MREAATRALEDAHMDWADIDAVVLGKAPDLFEGVMKPELYLTDALGAARQADVPGPHGRFGRRHDGHRGLTPGGVGTPPRVLAVGYQKQSEGNAQFALGSARAPRSAPAAPSRRTCAATSTAAARRADVGPMVAVKDRRNALKNPYAHLRLADITVETVQGVADDVGPGPLPRVVPVFGRRLRGRLHRRGRAARTRPRPDGRQRGSSGARCAPSPRQFPGRDPVRPVAALDCATDVYAPGRHHEPA